MRELGDEFLEKLRDLQADQFAARPHITFAEWSREAELRKTGGGGSYPAGGGMMGRYGGTSSVAPTGPSYRRSGNQAVGLKQQFGVPSGSSFGQNSSKYSQENRPQPSPWIDDVDMSSIWYSPMEPVWPFGPPYTNQPREWNFPVGYNLNYIPQRIGLYGMLRNMRQSWGVLSTVESTRMDQLLRIPWTIQRKDKPRASSTAVDQMRKFFRRPDGKLSYSQWTRKLLFDLFDIDAPSIFIDRDNGLGKIQNVQVLDGATIFPLIDDTGRRPDTQLEVDGDGVTYLRRQPAFQQIIYGLPMVNLSEDQIHYPIMRPRPEMPVFGYSPIEQIFIETMEAIRKTLYQVEFWRSGSMPELIVTVPDAWTPRQIASYQGHFDALLSGNLSLKSKVRFVPGGMKPFDIKNASGESLWSHRDEMLIRLACYAFSVSPTPFIQQNNRATAQNAATSAQEEGLYPLMSWFKDDVMDFIIQDAFGFDDIEFVYLPRPEVDLLKQAQIHKIQLDEGFRTRNEVREELGQEPFADGDIPTITTGAGVVPLHMAVEGQQFAMGSGGFGDDKPSVSPAGGKGKPEPTGNNKPENKPQRGAPRPHAEPSGAPTTVHKSASYKDVRAASQEAKGDLENFSHVQLKVGNFPKGHVWIQGLNISIENAKGSKRGEKTQDGTKRYVKMPAPYGYIRGTIGADGEAVDVYIGKKPKRDTVWVIDQDKVTPAGKNNGFDEHKVMLGYRTLDRALRDYSQSHFDGHGKDRIHDVVELSIDKLKQWLKSGNMKIPLAGQGFGQVVLRQKDIKKADTISVSTGLSSYDQGARRKKRKKKKRVPLRGPRWTELSA
jgi:Inorganic Pyrophosphatase/Phage portal protein